MALLLLLLQVLKRNGTTLPPAALFIIRYHSFYALHQHSAYAQLLDEQDKQMLPWLVAFQKCDLYSKTDNLLDVQELKPYYMGLIHK
jgi:inositol oxygenase